MFRMYKIKDAACFLEIEMFDLVLKFCWALNDQWRTKPYFHTKTYLEGKTRTLRIMKLEIWFHSYRDLRTR